ncbi:GntR family transcriptional regulator [Actinomadura yumaensis]|uniref:GntR family transcriptional regulator n=1 Tax=Actinomadura yumaensis TaxID=111807 RepID=A0ABW2CS11_9ACTN
MTDSAAFPVDRVLDQLRERITTGNYAAGTRLPAEADLAAEFGVARNTVRAALTVLRAEGLIETRRPSGSFVAPVPTPYEYEISAGDDAFDDTAAADVTIAEIDPYIGMFLAAGPSGLVIQRRRILPADHSPSDPPHGLTTLHVPYRAAKDTNLVRPAAPDGESAELAAAGLVPDEWTVQESVRGATPKEAELIGCPLGVPVLEHLWFGRRDGEALFVRMTVLTRGNLVVYRL